MNLVDYIFGLMAVIGFSIFVLSLIVGLIHELHKLWSWLVGSTGPTTSAKVTVDEMFQSTPYAATRNAKQAIEHKRNG